MIRPQQKKQKSEKNLKALKVGDKIVTKSGLHGKF
jgi:preprotein translocase subunit YajC